MIRSLQRGFTLIEMMISIVLGIIIIFGIGQIFVATRTSFSAQQGLSHIQQSGRFAMGFVAPAMRAAGDMAFNNASSLMQGEAAVPAAQASTTVAKLYQITNAATAGPDIAAAMDFGIPLQIHEWTGSAPGGTVSLPATLVAGVARTNWDPPIPQFVADRAIRGSDVIVTRYVDGKTFQINYDEGIATGIAGFAVQQICYPANKGMEFGMAVAVGKHGVQSEAETQFVNLLATRNNQLIAIGQNDMVVIAQAIIATTNPFVMRTYGISGFPGNYTDATRMCGPFNQNPPNRVARVGTARIDIFYIGRNATNGDPGLWRLSFDGSAGTPFAAEELVEGVENMQVLAGITKPLGTKRSSNRPDQYVTGAQLQTPAAIGLSGENIQSVSRRTLAARVSLLVRSEDNAAGATNNLTYQVAGTTINPWDDRRLRQVYEQTIAVRNRERLLNGAADSY